MTDRPVTGRGWAYAGVVLGGAVSIAANVAHSYVPPTGDKLPVETASLIADGKWAPELGAVLGAVFWPLALFVAIEILARTNWPDMTRWVLLRFGGLIPVGVVAAVVSYRHMSGLLEHYGEDPLTVAIGPLAVDGLMVVATGALIATGGRLLTRTVAANNADTEQATAEDSGQDTEPASDTGQPPDTEAATRRPANRPRTQRPTNRPRRADTGPATAADIRTVRKTNPEMTQAAVAKRLGVSVRTVRRHWQSNVTPIRETAAN